MTSPTINLIVDGDGAWPDLASRSDVIHYTGSIGMSALAGGMASGRTSVAIRIDLPDGRPVVIETSLRLLTSAVQAMLARHPDPDPGVHT